MRGRLLRLDRLIDLYDGARFAADVQARESLWAALGGYSTTQGIDASREVVLRLLDEAYAIEERSTVEPGGLSEDELSFLADAIMLLSTDLFLPDSAEALISQTLAYRLLTESGHPRIADNAHWRLYDHVRGVLEGATELGPELRPDVLVHAVYAEREDISVWLEDLAPHAQPPLPTAEQLWGLLEQHRNAVEQLPRWQPVVAARAHSEAELHAMIEDVLPWPRDPAWVLPKLPQGTAQRESLAPVVLLAEGKRIVEPTSTSPHEHEASSTASDSVAALEAVLLRDGRGIVLLAANPQAPATEFAATLTSLISAKVTTIEFAVHEPRLDGEGTVVVALPLHVVRPDDLHPGARALRDARIRIHLAGRGPRFRVDGRWLSATPALPSDIERVVADLRRAYPRERVIGLSLGPDVQPQQVVDLLAILTGGISPQFLAAGLLLDPIAEIEGQPLADRVLADRLGLVEAQPTITVQGSEALSEDDRVRVEQATASVRECVPELETKLPKHGVMLSLPFTDGKLDKPRASARGLDAAALERFEACASDRLLGFHLRDGVGATTISLLIEAAASR